MSMKVRTRFAPSPTGYLHVGTLRTALFAYVFAKNQGGDFLLRIEDTDKSREVEGAIDHIKESLAWLGIEADEEPLQQSKRLDIYKEWAQKLVDGGKAYTDPYTPEEVQKFRETAQAAKKPFLFREHRPEKTEVPADWYGKQPLRFKTEVKATSWHDEVWGDLSAGEEATDDFILIKSDGYPTYNFAHIIDDQLSEISHVMRGEEFIASVPKFLMLYEALGLKAPKFATMPPILAAGGGKKLSKRDGAKDVLGYRDEDGFLADAVFNYTASLGWNDGTDQEIFTPEEIIEKFSLDRVQKSGAHFDVAKLNWMNWEHLKLLAEKDPKTRIKLLQKHNGLSDAYDTVRTAHILSLAQSKASDSDMLVDQINIFFKDPGYKINSDNISDIDKGLSTDRANQIVNSAISAISSVKQFSAENIEAALRQAMDELSAQPREFLNLVRWIVSGRKVSPNLFEMIKWLGKEETVKRLNDAI